MEPYVKVARVHAALSYLCLVFVLLLAYLLSSDVGRADRAPLLYLGVMTLFMGVHHAVSRGARAAKPWARVASIVLSVMMLPAIPLGTLIGGYLLFNNLPQWRVTPSPLPGQAAP